MPNISNKPAGKSIAKANNPPLYDNPPIHDLSIITHNSTQSVFGDEWFIQTNDQYEYLFE